MNKNLILAISLFISVTSFAQTKKLTLEDAVMQQNRNFRADKLLGFQWIPNTNKYIFLADAGKKLMGSETSNSKAVEMISLADMNKAMGSDFKSFAGIDWKDANTFIMSDGSKYYEYNTQSKTGKRMSQLPEGAENAEFDDATGNLAFTEKNNLYILDRNNVKTAVTNEPNEAI